MHCQLKILAHVTLNYMYSSMYCQLGDKILAHVCMHKHILRASSQGWAPRCPIHFVFVCLFLLYGCGVLDPGFSSSVLMIERETHNFIIRMSKYCIQYLVELTPIAHTVTLIYM